MAFHPSRFTVYNAGQTGAGLIAKYDATGVASTDEFVGGGEANLNAIKADVFWETHANPTTAAQRLQNERMEAVRAIVSQAEDGRGTPTQEAGRGLPIFLHAPNGIEIDVLRMDTTDTVTIGIRTVGQMKLRGGAWNLS